MTIFCDHVTLETLLDDPLIQAVMRADRVDRSDLAGQLASVGRSIDHAGLRSTSQRTFGLAALGRSWGARRKQGGDPFCSAGPPDHGRLLH